MALVPKLSEAVIVALAGQPKGVPIRYTCADGTGIPKGTLCVFSGANTVIPSNNTSALGFAGIAATEKVQDDGSTTIGLWTKGIFDISTGSNVDPIRAGEFVKISGANLVGPVMVIAALSGGALVGRATEASTGAGDIINVAMGIY